MTYKPNSSSREVNSGELCAPDVASVDKFTLETLASSSDKQVGCEHRFWFLEHLLAISHLITFSCTDLFQVRKKYRYMSRYIDLLRSKLPKVTLHTSKPYQGTAVLREQGSFEFRFVDG